MDVKIRSSGVFVQAVLVHDPLSLLAVRGPAGVENEGFPEPDPLRVAQVDSLIPPGRLPETGRRGTICPGSGGVLLVFVAEKVPFVLWASADPTFLCHSLTNMKVFMLINK